MNTNPVVDLLSSRSPAQSASQYPTTSWGDYWKQLENKQEMKASRFVKWNNCIN
jgi:hypothetical protein